MKTKFIFLLAVTVLAAGLLYMNREAFSLNPFATEAAFSNISRVAVDSGGAVYTVTDSKRSIQKVESSGKLVYIKQSNELAKPGTLQLFNSIAADSDGNLYALVTELDSYGLKVSGEQIVKISPDGKHVNTLYEASYALSDNLLRVGKIQSLSTKDGFLYFYQKERQSASLLRLPTSDGVGSQKPEVVRQLDLGEDRYLNELAGTDPDKMFFTTKRGSLYALTDQIASLLFPGTTPNKQLNFPVGITTRDHVNVYFIDYHQASINRINSNREAYPVESLLSLDALSSQYPDKAFSDFVHIAIGNGQITVATGDQLIQISPRGEIMGVIDEYRYPAKMMWLGMGYWLLIAAFAALLLYNLRFIYIHLMKRKVYLLLKQLAVIVPVVLLSMLGLSYSVFSSFSAEIKEDTNDQLELLASNGKFLVDGRHLEQLNSPNDYMSADYIAIKQRLNDLFSQNSQDRDGLYNTLYRYIDGQLYIIMDDDDSVTMFQPFEVNEENLLVLEKGQIVSGEWEDSSGQWMYALGPLYDSSGSIIGIYETGKDMVGVTQSNLNILSDILKIIALIGVLLLLVITLLTAYLLSSIRKLRRNVNLIASGEWDVEVQINTKDEVQELGERFNMMAGSIRRYFEQITKLSNSYFRFVPQQFLKVLGKTNMTQVQLGEQAKRQMTILVCNMRNFNEFSSSLSTEENFKFINSFLKQFGPVIREFDGFTSRYLGPGMLTMFPNEPGEAIKAAVRLRETLVSYNEGRLRAGYEPIDIGISIHSGDVMIGIIGEEQRMEGSVVSNHVQLSQELEKMSQKLGVSVLVTEDTLRMMKRAIPGRYRRLGAFQVDEGQEKIALYDVYEGDPEHIRRLKDETKKQFETAVELYQNGKFYDAREHFVAVVKKNRYDLAAKQYFFACDRFYQEGVAPEWNNAMKIS